MNKAYYLTRSLPVKVQVLLDPRRDLHLRTSDYPVIRDSIDRIVEQPIAEREGMLVFGPMWDYIWSEINE